jgi:hypothetical protein
MSITHELEGIGRLVAERLQKLHHRAGVGEVIIMDKFV